MSYQESLNSDGTWSLDSGSDTESQSRGTGVSLSGSGSFTQSGQVTDGSGASIGSWSLSGTITEDAGQSSGSGYFTTATVQSGAWSMTDGGASASYTEYSDWSWAGSGTISDGPLSGSFSQGAGSGSFFSDVENESSTGKVTETITVKQSQGTAFTRDVEGTLAFSGATGTYTSKVGNNHSWSQDLTRVLVDGVLSSQSGSQRTDDFDSNASKFSGEGTYAVNQYPEGGHISYKFDTGSYGGSHAEFKYVNGDWQRTAGTDTGGGHDTSNYSRDEINKYYPKYGIVGVLNKGSFDSHTLNWDKTATYQPPSSGRRGFIRDLRALV